MKSNATCVCRFSYILVVSLQTAVLQGSRLHRPPSAKEHDALPRSVPDFCIGSVRKWVINYHLMNCLISLSMRCVTKGVNFTKAIGFGTELMAVQFHFRFSLFSVIFWNYFRRYGSSFTGGMPPTASMNHTSQRQRTIADDATLWMDLVLLDFSISMLQ